MVLSNFIRRSVRRKGNKANESCGHQKSPSTSSSLHIGSPIVLDIKEESPAVVHTSPLVQLNISDSNEAWFPQELLRTTSPSLRPSPPRFPKDMGTQNDLAQETRIHPLCGESPSHSRTASIGLALRKKSIPAPILIPGADLLVPNVHIGDSTTSTRPFPPKSPQSSADPSALKPPSPSASENLSSISGTTLARALIASSFMLPPNEHCGSRRRSGIVRQDSAILPCGDVFFLSNLGKSPSTPPAREKVADSDIPSKPKPHPPMKSGASTESEYPMSDCYITSPETSSASPRRALPTREVPPFTPSTSTKVPPSTVPDVIPQHNGDTSLVAGNGIFDVPKSAVVEMPLPTNSHNITLQEEHTLDEFDFVPPEPFLPFATPDSESSVSFIAPLPKRHGMIRAHRKRRIGGTFFIRNSPKDGSAEGREGCPMSSASSSEHDYGELLNYDLTVSPGSSSSSRGLSSSSVGYQTFPETPMAFSPLGSPEYAVLARSDSLLRKTSWSPKFARPGIGKPYSSVRVVRRHMEIIEDVANTAALRRSQSSSLPRQMMSSPRIAKSSASPRPANDDTIPLPGTSQTGSQNSLEFKTTLHRNPLGCISSSSSCLPEEEALQALEQRSSSSLPSILIGGVDPSCDPMAVLASAAGSSVESLASVPLPHSPGASSGSVTVPSPFTSPLQSPPSSSNTAVSQSLPLKSPQYAPSSSTGGSSFHPSPLSSASFRQPRFPQVPSLPIISGTSDDLVSHSPPPPPYHIAVSERTPHHADTTSIPFLPRSLPVDPGCQHSRQISDSCVSSTTRVRGRARPPLPIGPRRPIGPAQPPSGAFIPGVHDRNGFISSVGGPADRPRSIWRKLHSVASKPPPKFQNPPPKWRGLTLEAAHWTFTSAQLHQIASQAIQQSSEGSSLRLMRLETLEGEIADEVHRLELQHTDVKAQYKAHVRKRWMLMGALAGHIEGARMNGTATALRTMEELTEVLSALDHLAERMHEIALRLAQLKSLREVHNASALAMVVRKINGLFVRQMAEKDRLLDQVGALQTERDEAWKHAENIAQEYDVLSERVKDVGAHAAIGVDSASLPDVQSSTSKRCSARISAVRKSSVRLSQAGLWTRTQRPRALARPTSLRLESIPATPNSSGLQTDFMMNTGVSLSVYSDTGESDTWEFSEAQRELYELLGLSVPPSQASWRRRTMSEPDSSRIPALSSRPVSDLCEKRARFREDHRLTKSVVLDDRLRPVGQHGCIISPS